MQLLIKPADVAITPATQGRKSGRRIHANRSLKRLVTVPVSLICNGVADHFSAPDKSVNKLRRNLAAGSRSIRHRDNSIPTRDHLVPEFGNRFERSREVNRRRALGFGQDRAGQFQVIRRARFRTVGPYHGKCGTTGFLQRIAQEKQVLQPESDPSRL